MLVDSMVGHHSKYQKGLNNLNNLCINDDLRGDWEDFHPELSSRKNYMVLWINVIIDLKYCNSLSSLRS